MHPTIPCRTVDLRQPLPGLPSVPFSPPPLALKRTFIIQYETYHMFCHAPTIPCRTLDLRLALREAAQVVEAASATLASEPASRDAAGTLATETLILSALERATRSGAGAASGGAFGPAGGGGGGRGGAGGEEDGAGASAEEEGVATELPLLLLARSREDMQVGDGDGSATQGGGSSGLGWWRRRSCD